MLLARGSAPALCVLGARTRSRSALRPAEDAEDPAASAAGASIPWGALKAPPWEDLGGLVVPAEALVDKEASALGLEQDLEVASVQGALVEASAVASVALVEDSMVEWGARASPRAPRVASGR